MCASVWAGGLKEQRVRGESACVESARACVAPKKMSRDGKRGGLRGGDNFCYIQLDRIIYFPLKMFVLKTDFPSMFTRHPYFALALHVRCSPAENFGSQTV